MDAKTFQLSLSLKIHEFIKDKDVHPVQDEESTPTFDNWFDCFLDFMGYDVKEE